MIRALLMEPQRAFTQADLAAASGVDKGRVSRLVRRLEAMDLVVRDGRSFRLKDPMLALDAWRDLRDTTVERVFLAAYGSPLLQAFVGIGGEAGHVRPRAGENPLHQAFVEAKKAELRGRMGEGGLPEALIRALIYVGRAFGGTDERIFAAICRCRAEHSQSGAVPLDVFKQRVREQHFMLLLDEEAALAALPDLLPDDEEQRRTAFDVLGTVVTATGDLNKDARTRLARVAELFGLTEKGMDRRMEKGSEKVRARSAALTASTPLRARRKKG